MRSRIKHPLFDANNMEIHCRCPVTVRHHGYPRCNHKYHVIAPTLALVCATFQGMFRTPSYPCTTTKLKLIHIDQNCTPLPTMCFETMQVFFRVPHVPACSITPCASLIARECRENVGLQCMKIAGFCHVHTFLHLLEVSFSVDFRNQPRCHFTH